MSALTKLDPRSPEGKVMRALTVPRFDETFLTPVALATTTGLHVQLVEEIFLEFEREGFISKRPNLTDITRRSYWYSPTLAGFEALYGQPEALALQSKVLIALEQSTRFLPDIESGKINGVAVNTDVIHDVLKEMELQGLVNSKPDLLFEEADRLRRWQLTGKGARLLESARQEASDLSHDL